MWNRVGGRACVSMCIRECIHSHLEVRHERTGYSNSRPTSLIREYSIGRFYAICSTRRSRNWDAFKASNDHAATHKWRYGFRCQDLSGESWVGQETSQSKEE